jgi:hypothetical protein
MKVHKFLIYVILSLSIIKMCGPICVSLSIRKTPRNRVFVARSGKVAKSDRHFFEWWRHINSLLPDHRI